MCRSADIHGFNFNNNVDRNRLKINGFYVRLSLSSRACTPSPESLTLVYLPRINASPLDINDSKIRPDSPAFVTLHRVVLGEVVFASRERVRASEGVRFEVYCGGEEKVVKGIFRRGEDEEWRMECKCALERKMVGFEVTAAEVCVAAEGEGRRVAMREKVEMVVKRKRKIFQGLEEIPEEREVVEEEEEEDDKTDGCGGVGCLGGEGGDQSGLDGGDCEVKDDGGDEEMEMEMEGVRWAVDVGILVLSLGLGFLVSKASFKSLKLRRIL